MSNPTSPRVLSLLVPLLLPLLLGACKPGSGTHTPGGDAVVDRGEAGTPSNVTSVTFASVGVPHVAAITLVSLDATGTTALTRDSSGSVRLWPALDGLREPLIVPVRDPRAMAVATRADGWTLALLDGAGGARIVGVDAAGGMQPLASLPPTDPLQDIVVLPGGEQLLAVGNDHVIRLLARDGRELARLDVPGVRPASLRVAWTGEGTTKVVAVTTGEFDGSQGRFAVKLLPLELGASSLALAAQDRTIHLDSPPTTDNPTIAPDGRSAVFLQRQQLGGATWKVHAMQLDDGREVSIDSEIGLGQQPRLGLMPEGRVLLDDGSGLGRIVDFRERHVELIGLRSSPTVNHFATAFAANQRVLPANNWLAVHDLATDDLVYLGYEQVNVTDAGLSPSGESVVWALGDRVAVEAVGSNEVLEVPGTRASSQRFVNFVDEDRIMTLDWTGGAELIRWRDGEVIDAVDLGNPTQTAELARDGHGNAVVFVRTSLWQNPTILDVRGSEFGPRYVAHATANLAGLLAPQDAPIEDWGAWTLDGAGQLRRFTLAQLDQGIDTKEALTGGELLSYGLPEQFAIDARGQQYWVRTTGTRPVLHVVRGTTTVELELAPGFVTRLTPSPDGARIAVVQQRDANQIVTVVDTKSMQPIWGQPVPALNGLAWSDTGDRVALPATFGGGVVLDAEDGSAEAARCGLAFEARRSPPVNIGFFSAVSVCDL